MPSAAMIMSIRRAKQAARAAQAEPAAEAPAAAAAATTPAPPPPPPPGPPAEKARRRQNPAMDLPPATATTTPPPPRYREPAHTPRTPRGLPIDTIHRPRCRRCRSTLLEFDHTHNRNGIDRAYATCKACGRRSYAFLP